VDAVNAVLAAGPPERLIHVYGPTESTTFASWHEVTLDVQTDTAASETIPIGLPVSNTTLYVVDRGGELVPTGVVGELWIGGDGLALGYLDEPALTAERFGPDPFGEDPWGRLYHTGDLVRRRHDGAIEFVGRTDRQVKLRGFRIEPEEVERAMRSHPDVADALVEVVSPGGDPRLGAWAVPVEGANLDSSSLLDHLRTVLPAYTVPPAVGIVPAIPIGPNGKVDLSRLPAPFDSIAPADEHLDRPTASMIEIFEQVLGVAGVGPHDSFFDLGGHSLLAVELIAVAERRLGHRLPLASLFEDATPVGLARLVETRNHDGQHEHDGLITFTSGASDFPVFLFHHPSGTVLAYEPLARRIGDGRTVYGIQARGVDGVGRPGETIEEMGEQYADLIELANPTGSCILAGHSLGGLLAWQTAHSLRRRGRDVAMVALFDSRVPRRGWVEIDGELRKLTRLGRGRRSMRRFGADLVYGMRYSWYSMRGAAAPPALARIRQIRSSSQAFEAYRPAPLDQKVVFFAALGSGAEIPGAGPSDEEWRTLAGSIEVVAVPGKHTGDDSLLAEPNVGVLAHEFSVRIARLEHGADRPADGRLDPRATVESNGEDDARLQDAAPAEPERR
jgi:thioesterase domain-containing protein/acyl carrier protein